MTFWKWSRTAATNASADSTINWAEGQAPSSVNDSARAVMAAAAKYRDDMAGAIVSTGTSTAYAVSSYQVFDTLAHLDGQTIYFSPHATSGSPATLAVDGLAAKPLRVAPGVELPSGTLVQGTPYGCLYNNTAGEFYLRNFIANPYIIPIGAMLPYTGATAPNSSFVLPFGQAISRTTYATYFSLIGTNCGAGDGSTTFNVPDYRGRAFVGQDNMGGVSASRISTALWNGGGAETVTIAQANLPNLNFTVSDPGHAHSLHFANAWLGNSAGGHWATASPGDLAIALQNDFGTNSATTGISVNSGGSGAALNKMPPYLVGTYILRVI